MPRTLYVCESQPVVVAGLKAILVDCQDLEIVGQASGSAEALVALTHLKPEIVLLGYSANARTVMGDLPRLIEANSQSHFVLWVVEVAEIDCLRALQLGVKGVLRKTAGTDKIVDCLRTVAAGQIWLEEPNIERTPHDSRRSLPRMTPRERQIVDLVCRGMKNKEIAAALSITPGTVKVHLMHIFEKTGVKDRFQLALHGRHLASAGDSSHGAGSVADPFAARVSAGW